MISSATHLPSAKLVLHALIQCRHRLLAGFPEERWETRRGRLIARLRGSVVRELAESRETVLNRLRRYFQELSDQRLPQTLLDVLVHVQRAFGANSGEPAAMLAASDFAFEGEGLDGVLRWTIKSDSGRNVVVRLGSHVIDLEGVVVRVILENVHPCTLERVGDQLSASVVIPRSEFESDAAIRLEIVEDSKSGEAH